MNMSNEIEQFITNFKDGYASVMEEVFTRNNCYHFAVILQQQFGTEIMYDQDEMHFVSIDDDNQVYDIRGNVTNEYNTSKLILWDDYEGLDKGLINDCCIDLNGDRIERNY